MISKGINVNIRAIDMELTPAINDYAIKKITNLEKLLQKIQDNGGEVLVHLEVGKNTNHHKSGMVYHTDCSITIDGEQFYSSSDKEDLYESIDACKDQLFNEITKKKTKRTAFFRKGARKMKDMMRGMKFWKNS